MVATERSPKTSRRAPYLPGLDGIRAVAVLAVVAYHANFLWAAGGYLGVEVFFVVSGYLITTLLLQEGDRTGRIDLKRFWLRRARRLLPALWVVLTAVALWALVEGDAAHLRGEFVAGLTYVTNWYWVWTGTSYFAQLGRPSPLRHLWSLAVEEQFYLFFPIALVILAALSRRRRPVLGMLLAGGACCSWVLLAVLWRDGHDPSGEYFATWTRLGGLLIGAALATFWKPWRVRRERVAARARLAIDLAGVGAVLVLLWAHLRLEDRSWFLYHGGFAVVDLATAVLIVAVTHPSARIRQVFSMRPLRWVGERSYGIYLWHWPIFTITRPGIDVGWSSPVVWLVRIVATVLAVQLSYKYVEAPVRAGRLGAWWARHTPNRWVPAALVGGAVAVLAGCVAVAGSASNPIIASIREGERAAEAQARITSTSDAASTTSTTGAGSPAGSTAIGVSITSSSVVTPAGGAADPGSTTTSPSTSAVTSSVPAAVSPAPTASPVVAVGDSVLLGAFKALQSKVPGIYIDAKVSRQFREGITELATLKQLGKVGPVVLVHLGNNGEVSDASIDTLMAELADVPTVVFVTVHIPGIRWEGSVNTALAAAATRYPGKVRLADWHAASDGQRSWFYKDGIHLNPEGQTHYAELIAGVLGY